MCRSKLEGGRRCQCHGPTRTAGYQRALRAAQRAAADGNVAFLTSPRPGRKPEPGSHTLAMVGSSGRAVGWSDGLFAGDPELVARAKAICPDPFDPELVAKALEAIRSAEGSISDQAQPTSEGGNVANEASLAGREHETAYVPNGANPEQAEQEPTVADQALALTAPGTAGPVDDGRDAVLGAVLAGAGKVGV